MTKVSFYKLSNGFASKMLKPNLNFCNSQSILNENPILMDRLGLNQTKLYEYRLSRFNLGNKIPNPLQLSSSSFEQALKLHFNSGNNQTILNENSTFLQRPNITNLSLASLPSQVNWGGPIAKSPSVLSSCFEPKALNLQSIFKAVARNPTNLVGG